jgi:hypothetical protein
MRFHAEPSRFVITNHSVCGTIRDLVDPRSLVWELVTRDEDQARVCVQYVHLEAYFR